MDGCPGLRPAPWTQAAVGRGRQTLVADGTACTSKQHVLVCGPGSGAVETPQPQAGRGSGACGGPAGRRAPCWHRYLLCRHIHEATLVWCSWRCPRGSGHHPYTQALLALLQREAGAGDAMDSRCGHKPLLQAPPAALREDSVPGAHHAPWPDLAWGSECVCSVRLFTWLCPGHGSCVPVPGPAHHPLLHRRHCSPLTSQSHQPSLPTGPRPRAVLLAVSVTG